jgi:hypothetical protein
MNNRIGWTAAILGVTLVLLGGLGCAATKPSSDPWVVNYVGSPDDVWVACHIALVDLDYDVESENREDGRVRAVRPGAEEGTIEVLSLDQIMRSDDVKVYIRAAAGPDQPAMDAARKETLAKEFMALVNGLLYK